MSCVARTAAALSPIWPDHAAAQYDRHHAGLADQPAGRVPVQDGLHQARLEAVELQARVPQPGHLHHGLRAEHQPRPGRQAEQVDSARRDVLPHVPGGDPVPQKIQLVVQLGMDQVDLAQVRGRWVTGYPRPVLDRAPGVHVSLDADAGDESDPVADRLAERVLAVLADGGYEC